MREISSKVETLETVRIQYETMQEYVSDRKKRINDKWYEVGHASTPLPCITWERRTNND